VLLSYEKEERLDNSLPKMNRRRLTLLVIVLLGLACVAAVVFRAKKPNQTSLQLQLVSRSVEQGKEIVVFSVAGAADRRILVTTATKFVQDLEERPFQDLQEALGLAKPEQTTRELLKVVPVADPKKTRKLFEVIASTNAPIWTLRVKVYLESAGLLTRLRGKSKAWKVMRSMGMPFLKAGWAAWDSFYPVESQILQCQIVESDSAAVSW